MEPNYRQRRFIAYYLGVSNGNATDAARRAGYPHPKENGTRLLSYVAVRAAIDAKLDQVAMGQDEILARLSDIASASLGDFIEVDEDGHRVSIIKGKRRGKMHVLKKVKTKVRTTTINKEVETEVETEIEIKDSYPALVKLAEYRGLIKSGLGAEKPETPYLHDEHGDIKPERD